MTNLQIDDQLAERLKQAAASQGRTPEDLAEEALAYHLDDITNRSHSLSETQRARMLESHAQAQRGEFVSSEEVDVFFENLLAKIDTR